MSEEGVKVDGKNMDDDDDITSSAVAAAKTTTTEAIHDVMNNNLKYEEERVVENMNENDDEVKEVEVMRITMSIPALSSLPLESANTTTTPEGNKNFLSFCIIM